MHFVLAPDIDFAKIKRITWPMDIFNIESPTIAIVIFGLNFWSFLVLSLLKPLFLKPYITILAATSALTAVENKILSVSNLIKKN